MVQTDIFKAIASNESYLGNNVFQLLPNPNEIIAKYGNRSATLDSIKQDPHVHSCIQSRKSATKGLNWELEFPESIVKANPEIKNILTDVFNKFDIDEIINDILDCPLYGFTPLEIIWRKEYINNNLKILPISLKGKPINWFYYDNHNILRFKSAQSQKGQVLPSYKFIVATNEATYLNPYGTSILGICLWYVAFKKGNWTFWLKLAEVFGFPHFVGKSSGSGTELEDMLAKLNKLRQDGAVVISKDDDITLLNVGAPGSGGGVHQGIIDSCNEEISKAILSQTLTTSIGDTGSFAASKTHAEVRGDVVLSDKKLVEKIFNRLIQFILEINYPNLPLGEIPKFIMYPDDDVDLPFAQVLQTLESSGRFKPTKEMYKQRLNFKDIEFNIEEQITPLVPVIAGKPTFAEIYDDNNQLLIDNKVTSIVDESKDFMKDMLEPVFKLINNSKDYNESLKNLAKLFPTITTKELEDKLTALMFMSDTIGRYSVKDEVDNFG